MTRRTCNDCRRPSRFEQCSDCYLQACRDLYCACPGYRLVERIPAFDAVQCAKCARPFRT